MNQINEADPSGKLLALVKNKMKSSKGVGKGGKGKGKARKCFECDEEGHIAADCPVRAERVKNGGPERLPRDARGGRGGDAEMGKGKGGKAEEKLARATEKAARAGRQGRTGRPTTKARALSETPSGCTGGQVPRKVARRPLGFKGPHST